MAVADRDQADRGADVVDRDPRSARRRTRRVTIVVAVVLLIAAVGGGVWWWATVARAQAERTAAQALVADVVRAYEQRDLSGIPSSPADAADRFRTAVGELGESTVTVGAAPVAIDEVGATTDLAIAWQLADGHEWRYTTRLELVRTDGDGPLWQVAWDPALVHPRLRGGDRLRVERRRPVRGDIVAADGAPIVTLRPVVNVFVQPSRVDDLDSLTNELERLLDVDGAALADRVERAADDALVPVITLRDDDYAVVEDDVYPLAGTVFRRSEQPLAPTRDFARAFLGAVGEVTAEQLEEQPGRYQRGDVVGRSGLQRTLDDRLRGTAGAAVLIVPGGDDGPDDSSADVLTEIEPTDGRDVAVTLRRRVQRAADGALADVEAPSALVAIDVPSGDILAIANGPAAAFDIATQGRYAPGSTFKVVTATRLLGDGVTPDSTIGCPVSATVDGRMFGNAEDTSLGDVPFATAFAQSCNTAFVELSRELEAGDLATAAEQWFGFGSRGDLGVGAFAGDIPREDSAVEVTAAAIGQGEVLMSPLVAADIAATVARGRWRQPRVLVEPAAGDQAVGAQLPHARALRRLTRAVVTEGSGSAVKGVPGPPVHGKTGTAEYGNDVPPRTHAWFIGYQDDLALAVLVAETTDSYGGEVAAPIAAEFLTALRAR